MGPRRSARIASARERQHQRSQSTYSHNSRGVLKTTRRTSKTRVKQSPLRRHNDSSTEKRFDFFKLPGEIRNLIYREAVQERDPIPLAGPLPSLLLASQQTRREASHWYYHDNTFNIFLHLEALEFSQLTQKLQDMSRDGFLQSLKHVELRLGGYDFHELIRLLPFVHLLRSLPFDTTASSWSVHSDFGLGSDSWLKVKIVGISHFTMPPHVQDVVEGLVAERLNMANRARDEGWLSAELDVEYSGAAYFHPDSNNPKTRGLEALRKNRERLRPRIATVGGGFRAR